MVEEDVTKVSYAQLYKLLNQHGSIIVFVKVTDLPSMKRGVSNAKTRETAKQQEAGFSVDETERISYSEPMPKTPEEEKQYPKNVVKIQISLSVKANIEVFAIRTVDGDPL